MCGKSVLLGDSDENPCVLHLLDDAADLPVVEPDRLTGMDLSLIHISIMERTILGVKLPIPHRPMMPALQASMPSQAFRRHLGFRSRLAKEPNLMPFISP